MAKQVLTIKADSDLIARIDALAEKTGESRSQVGERLLAAGVAEGERATELIESHWMGYVASVFLKNKAAVKAMAAMAGEEFDEEDHDRMVKRIQRLRGNQNQQEKKE